jgi:hypothetical protein
MCSTKSLIGGRKRRSMLCRKRRTTNSRVCWSKNLVPSAVLLLLLRLLLTVVEVTVVAVEVLPLP